MKKRKTIYVILAIIICVAIITISYALWTKTKIQKNPNQALTGCFDIAIQEESESIKLTNTFPISDEDGLNTKAYTFSVKNTCSVKAYYQLNLEVFQSSTLSSSYIKLSLNKESPVIISSLHKNEAVLEDTDAFLLKESELNAGEKEEYSLQMWMDQDTPQTEENKTFQSKITVNASSIKFTELADNSGAEAPVLNNGMIPVTWDGTSWIKADTTKEWYNYDNQWWANAVNVTDASRNTYLNANAGTKINMDDILFMWVWVPRYEYRYDNMGSQYAGGEGYWRPGAITINFISSKTMNPSASNFYVHDAFWWDLNDDGIKDIDEQLPGIWVAKFELSSDIECTPLVGEGCDLDTILPRSKPNQRSWRGASVGTYWTVLHEKMNGENNIYGLSNLDAHMIKNMEWGAIAYLSQSKYGKYGNPSFDWDEKEIYVNNSGEQYKYSITGCSAGTALAATLTPTCLYTYEKEIGGTGASTTGNVYGVYDMSGGSNEYVMGLTKVQNRENPDVAETGFSGEKTDGTVVSGRYGSLKNFGARYYDLYDYAQYSNDNKAERYHPGDATYEVCNEDFGWYSDYPDFISNNAVLSRGGSGEHESINTGIFRSYPEWSGQSSQRIATRATAVPLK